MAKLVRANAYNATPQPGVEVIKEKDGDTSIQKVNPLSVDLELDAGETDTKMDRLRHKNNIFSLGYVIGVMKSRVAARLQEVSNKNKRK